MRIWKGPSSGLQALGYIFFASARRTYVDLQVRLMARARFPIKSQLARRQGGVMRGQGPTLQGSASLAIREHPFGRSHVHLVRASRRTAQERVTHGGRLPANHGS